MHFSVVFCSWSPGIVCGSVTKTGCTLPEIATAHGWTTTTRPWWNILREWHIHPLSTCDPMRGWSSLRDLLERLVARNSAHSESARARNGSSISHKNMGRKLRFSTLDICSLHHESPPWRLGSPNAALATVRPLGKRFVGRPAMHWASKFEQFSPIKHWYDWKNVAANAEQWMIEVGDFIKFCRKYYKGATFFSHMFSYYFAP